MFSAQLLSHSYRLGVALVLQLLRQLVVVERVVAAGFGTLALSWLFVGILGGALVSAVGAATTNKELITITELTFNGSVLDALAREAAVRDHGLIVTTEGDRVGVVVLNLIEFRLLLSRLLKQQHVLQATVGSGTTGAVSVGAMLRGVEHVRATSARHGSASGRS